MHDPREQVFHYTKDGRQKSAFTEHATKRRSLKPRYCGSCYSRFVISIIEPQPCREPQSLSLSLSLHLLFAFCFLSVSWWDAVYRHTHVYIRRFSSYRGENRLSCGVMEKNSSYRSSRGERIPCDLVARR